MNATKRDRIITICLSVLSIGLLIPSAVLAVEEEGVLNQGNEKAIDVAGIRKNNLSELKRRIKESDPSAGKFNIQSMSLSFDPDGSLREGLMDYVLNQGSTDNNELCQFRKESGTESATIKHISGSVDLKNGFYRNTALTDAAFTLIAITYTDDGLSYDYNYAGTVVGDGSSPEKRIDGSVSDYLFQNGNLTEIDYLQKGKTFVQLSKVHWANNMVDKTVRYYLSV